jgi:O-antigen ligase
MAMKLNNKLIFILIVFFIPLIEFLNLASIKLYEPIIDENSGRVITANFLTIFIMGSLIFLLYFTSKDLKYKISKHTIHNTIIISALFSLSISYSLVGVYVKILHLITIIFYCIFVNLILTKELDLKNFLLNLLIINTSVTLALFAFKLYTEGFSVRMARGGLNLFTISDMIFRNFLILIGLNMLNSDKHKTSVSRSINRRIFRVNFFISLVSASRAGLLLFTPLAFPKIFLFLSISSVILWVPFNTVMLGLTDDIYDLNHTFYLLKRIISLLNISIIDIFLNSRGDIWLDAYENFKISPFWGHGLGSFPVVSSKSLDSAHNFFLNILVENGLIGGVICLAALVLFFLRLRTAIGKIILFAFIIFSFISGASFMQSVGTISGLNYFMVLITLCIAINPNKYKSLIVERS